MADKTIFQFNADVYNSEDVKNFSFEHCEYLTNADEENVTKFDGNDLENILNDNLLDVDNCFYRVF